MRIQNLFALDPLPDTFDDATVQRDDIESVDTSHVDPYRQGTEIRNQHQYLAGPYKVLSGERGHMVTQQPIGQGTWRVPATITWNDTNRFDPIAFITTPAMLAPSLSYADDEPATPQLYDGLLDPITIVTTTLPYGSVVVELRVFDGAIMDGNVRQDRAASDAVVTVGEFAQKNAGVAFVDSFDGDVDAQRDISDADVGPFFDSDNACYELFNREFWPHDAPVGADAEVIVNIVTLTTRGDPYVQSWQRSATAGFQFTSALGTDSVAFGDMVHR
jgi:hypothetical protein